MWLSNKGLLQNNERRYFRLQFPVEKLALDGDLVSCDLDAPDKLEPEGSLPVVDIEKVDGDSYSNADATNEPCNNGRGRASFSVQVGHRQRPSQ